MHGALLVILLAAMVTGGCAYNKRTTEITIYSGSDTTIDASGAQNTTGTSQMPQADLSPLVKAAQDAIGGKASSIVDRITDMIGGDDEITETEALEDNDANVVPTDTGDVEEVD